MIIPIRCFGCGKVLADKRKTFIELTLKEQFKNEIDIEAEKEEFIDLSRPEVKKMAAGRAMDQLGLTRDCCRSIMLGTIDLLEEISY
jgi:DNA-directed RNA polymerase I, II, and III subunit RPABC5